MSTIAWCGLGLVVVVVGYVLVRSVPDITRYMKIRRM